MACSSTPVDASSGSADTASGSADGAASTDAAPAANPSPVAEGSKPVALKGTFSFTEGPTANADGTIFFPDQPSNRILRVEEDGSITDWLKPSGRANGMCFAPGGELIVCADENNELWSIAPDGTKTVLAATFEGKRLNGPNDVWVAPAVAPVPGALYLTDPFYKRSWWKHSGQPQAKQSVYRLDPGSSELVPVATDLVQPNGIIGSPDGKTLYVADIGANKTWRYTITADGSLADKTLFCSMGSDGMTLDAEGNVYLTGRGVTVFSRSGEKIATIGVRAGWTANVSFGGSDRKTLYITASERVFTLQMRVRGAFDVGK